MLGSAPDGARASSRKLEFRLDIPSIARDRVLRERNNY